MEPLVDIVLATFNGAAHLEAQLASLQAQTYRNWRLIVRDDGSSDATLDILAKFTADDARVTIIPGNDDGDGASGPVAAFAEVLGHSDAPYFMFCDQDDVWLPEKTTLLLAALREIEGGDAPCLAHSDLRVVDEHLAEIAPSFWGRLKLDPSRATATSLLLRNEVTGCAMMGNAALREAMLPMPESVIMHDWWAALIAAHKGRMTSMAQPTVLYRRHGRNVTGLGGAEGSWRAVVALSRAKGFGLPRSRAHLISLQAQARAVAPFVGGGVAAEFGSLGAGGILRRKTFLARHGMIRWNDPLWTLAYHWVI